MESNSLKLPESYLCLARIISEGGWGLFELKEEVDAYGNYLGRAQSELEMGSGPWSKSVMEEVASGYGAGNLSPEELQAWNTDLATRPGVIPFIADFSLIVCFGGSPQADPFCFDFREERREPSVIFWDPTEGWRRVAPDFKTFIGLYRPKPHLLRPGDNRFEAVENSVARTQDALAKIETDRQPKRLS